MREGKIILPMEDNSHEPLDVVHGHLKRALCGTFGGVTVSYGEGSWIDQGRVWIEPVAIFTVAAEDTALNNAALHKFAAAHGEMARQLAVYSCGFDGRVSIANLPQAAGAVAA